MSEQCSRLEGNKCYRKQKNQSRTQGLGNAEGGESTSHERVRFEQRLGGEEVIRSYPCIDR